MNLPTFLRRGLGQAQASYRHGLPRPELDLSTLDGRRIGLLKLDGIGDFVLASGFLQLCRAQWPNAQVTLFCRQPVGQLARHQFPGWTVVELPVRTKPLRQLYGQPAVRRLLQAHPLLDLLIDLRTYRDMADSVTASWIPARWKLGLANAYPEEFSWVRLPAEDRIYDRLIPLPGRVDPGSTQDLQNHRQLAKLLFPGVPQSGELFPQLSVSADDCAALAVRLRSQFAFHADQPFLLVCPGTSSPLKEYPACELAAALEQVRAGCSLPMAIAGSLQDARSIQPLLAALKGEGVTDLSGALTLSEHVTLISLAKAVLSMDSCHAHIAGAVGTPAVIVLGRGQYGVFGPWGESPTFRWLTGPGASAAGSFVTQRPLSAEDVPPEEIAQSLVAVLQSAGGLPTPGNGGGR